MTDSGSAGHGSRAIRVFVLVVPFAASVVFAWQLSGLLPSVSTWPMAILRWLVIAVASTSVMVAFDRLTRRLLPLAVLLGLTLAFPDQAPSRFRIAIRIGTTLQLREIIADARAGRIGDTPAEAAEKLLELVGALSVHDRLTRGHSERVRGYTHMVGEELKITGAELDHLRWSALLHDIGKLLVSAEVLVDDVRSRHDRHGAGRRRRPRAGDRDADRIRSARLVGVRHHRRRQPCGVRQVLSKPPELAQGVLPRGR